MIDIGNGKEPGVSKAINLDRTTRYRNQDIKDSNNISRGLKFGDIRNRCSSKENSNKDSLMFNKHDISHKILRDISSINNSILNFRAGSRRWNHNIGSLMEDLNVKMKNIEGKRPRRLKKDASKKISS